MHLEPHEFRVCVNIDLRHQSLSRRRYSSRSVPSGEERGETAVFAGYAEMPREISSYFKYIFQKIKYPKSTLRQILAARPISPEDVEAFWFERSFSKS